MIGQRRVDAAVGGDPRRQRRGRAPATALRRRRRTARRDCGRRHRRRLRRDAAALVHGLDGVAVGDAVLQTGVGVAGGGDLRDLHAAAQDAVARDAGSVADRVPAQRHLRVAPRCNEAGGCRRERGRACGRRAAAGAGKSPAGRARTAARARDGPGDGGDVSAQSGDRGVDPEGVRAVGQARVGGRRTATRGGLRIERALEARAGPGPEGERGVRDLRGAAAAGPRCDRDRQVPGGEEHLRLTHRSAGCLLPRRTVGASATRRSQRGSLTVKRELGAKRER